MLYSCADGYAAPELGASCVPPAEGVQAADRAKAATATLAPPGAWDRHPIVIGSNLTLTYISSVSRACLTGYRQPFVDLLAELLDQDPHALCVLLQRILSVAGGRVEVLPAEIASDDQDAEQAVQIADRFRQEFDAIPARAQALSCLLWGDFYGVSAAEIDWARSFDGWRISGLRGIHTRRLAYPDASTWDLFIWDQGQLGFTQNVKTGRGVGGYHGLRIADYPGKFVVHTPTLRAEYPTRDGIGRVIAVYMALKRMATRAVAADIERYTRPQGVATYTTTTTGNPRGASPEDIAAADAAIKAFGAGSLSAITLPDTVKIDLLKAAQAMKPEDFMAYLDQAISKVAVGQTYTVEPGKYGARGSAEQGKEQLLDVIRYSAGSLCDSLERDAVSPWMLRNYEPAIQHLAPRLRIHIDSVLTPEQVAKIIKSAVDSGIPIDVDVEAAKMGVSVVPKQERERLKAEAAALAKAQTPAPEPSDGAKQAIREADPEYDDPANDTPMRDTPGGICMTDGASSGGLIVALRIPADLAQQLALPGGEHAEDLHVTVAHLGSVQERSPKDFAALRLQLEALMQRWAAPLVLTLGGIGRFCGEDGDAFYLSVDCPVLHTLRADIDAALTGIGLAPSQHHGLSPHLTLAYLAPEALSPLRRFEPVTLALNAVEVWAGPFREAFPLSSVVQAA